MSATTQFDQSSRGTHRHYALQPPMARNRPINRAGPALEDLDLTQITRPTQAHHPQHL
ncbi:MAG TPA: hypothetical protein VKR06_17735 [Ktedonosporobacter sp.]|nr:hypothetical protein [Ktedonosporobacter sp.]